MGCLDNLRLQEPERPPFFDVLEASFKVTVRRRQDAEAFGDQHELRNRLNLALLHDLLPMRLDGSFGDIQLMGNLLVELAASHQGEEAWQPDSAARPVAVRRRDQGILQGFHALVATARRAAECFANEKITGSSRIPRRTGRVQFSGWKVGLWGRRH
jgi:hypothetical protein